MKGIILDIAPPMGAFEQSGVDKKQTQGSLRLEDTFYKKPIIRNILQGTSEWDEVRLKKITASNFRLVQSSGTGRETYMRRLLAEQLTGLKQKDDWLGNQWTNFGHEYEPMARAYHALEQCIKIKQIGFVEVSPDIGFSPDGEIGRPGMLEIKCRSAGVQIQTLEAGRMPPSVRWQVQFSLWAWKKKWCDYVSFCPFMKSDANKYFYRRIERDEVTITQIRNEVTRFLNEMDSREAKLNGTAFAKRAVIV